MPKIIDFARATIREGELWRPCPDCDRLAAMTPDARLSDSCARLPTVTRVATSAAKLASSALRIAVRDRLSASTRVRGSGCHGGDVRTSTTLDRYTYSTSERDSRSCGPLLPSRCLGRRRPLMKRRRPLPWRGLDLHSYLSGWPDLNRRPLRPERSALPSCATPRGVLSNTIRRLRRREIGIPSAGETAGQRGISVRIVASGRQAKRIGAVGWVPRPAETCSQASVPGQRCRPLAIACGQVAVRGQGAVAGHADLAAVGVAGQQQREAVGGHRRPGPGRRGCG